MKPVDEKCPLCGHVNRGLNLIETDGWFICERCKNDVQLLKYAELCKIPVLTGKDLAAIAEQRR